MTSTDVDARRGEEGVGKSKTREVSRRARSSSATSARGGKRERYVAFDTGRPRVREDDATDSVKSVLAPAGLEREGMRDDIGAWDSVWFAVDEVAEAGKKYRQSPQ